MAGLWKRAMEVLGLSDGDAYADFEAYEDQGAPSPPRRPQSTRPEPDGVATVRAVSQSQSPDGSGSGIGGSGIGGVSILPRSPAVRTVTAVAQQVKVHTMTPNEFGHCQEIGERFRGGQPVIVNLGDVDRELTRRIVDFASGLVYGLNGTMKKAGEKVYLLTPTNVEVSADERRKLKDRGLLA